MNIVIYLILLFGGTYVVDGDTINIGSDRIRLECIDAPESKQPYGQDAKKALEQMMIGRDITVSVSSTDRYGRKIGWVILDGRDTANVMMVKKGYAHWYEYYCKDNTRLKQLQARAQRLELGLWFNNNPINPYRWRKGDR